MRPGCLPEKNWGAARQAADQIVEQYRLADGAAEGTRTPDPLITKKIASRTKTDQHAAFRGIFFFKFNQLMQVEQS